MEQDYDNQSLYILQREAKLNTNIYKIGMTTKGFLQRYKNETSYRNCRVVEVREVSDCIEAEKKLKYQLHKNGFKTCKEIDPTYEGIEDYVVNDYNKFIIIFNEVCDEFKLNIDQKISPELIENKNINSKLNIDLEFKTLISKKKIVSDLITMNYRSEILSTWENEFNNIFTPIEIIRGNGYFRNNTLKVYLIDYRLMHRLFNDIYRITQTDFLNKLKQVVDYDFNKYKGRITYVNLNEQTTRETAARLLLIKPTSIKLFIRVKYLFEKLNYGYNLIDEELLTNLKNYDKLEYNEIINTLIKTNNPIVLQHLLKEKFQLIIQSDDDNEPNIDFKNKTIIIPIKLFNIYNKFKITFKHNPYLEYNIIKEYNILNENSVEDLFESHKQLDTILRFVLMEDKNNAFLKCILDFMYNKIYNVNGNLNTSKSKVYINKFKGKNKTDFENQYPLFKNINNETKEKIYKLLDETV